MTFSFWNHKWEKIFAFWRLSVHPTSVTGTENSAFIPTQAQFFKSMFISFGELFISCTRMWSNLLGLLTNRAQTQKMCITVLVNADVANANVQVVFNATAIANILETLSSFPGSNDSKISCLLGLAPINQWPRPCFMLFSSFSLFS